MDVGGEDGLGSCDVGSDLGDIENDIGLGAVVRLGWGEARRLDDNLETPVQSRSRGR